MAFVAYCRSRVKGTASTREVVLSMPMVSLPSGGMITLMAWGMITRRMMREGFMPSALAASVWPASTDSSPDRMISAR